MATAWNAINAVIFCIEAKKLWHESEALGICMIIRKGLGVDGYAANLPHDIKVWLHTLEE